MFLKIGLILECNPLKWLQFTNYFTLLSFNHAVMEISFSWMCIHGMFVLRNTQVVCESWHRMFFFCDFGKSEKSRLSPWHPAILECESPYRITDTRGSGDQKRGQMAAWSRCLDSRISPTVTPTHQLLSTVTLRLKQRKHHLYLVL